MNLQTAALAIILIVLIFCAVPALIANRHERALRLAAEDAAKRRQSLLSFCNDDVMRARRHGYSFHVDGDRKRLVATHPAGGAFARKRAWNLDNVSLCTMAAIGA